MTERKHFKQLVRARMSKTGETYSTARRQVIRQADTSTVPNQYPHHYPGNVPGSAALRALLSQAGARAPHTREPFSEAMVFGIAGGIGAGMFTFHYAKENFSSFFVAGRHLWQDHAAWALAAAKRMGVKALVRESSAAKPGEKHLRELLNGGRPVLAWITFRGKMYHVVSVHGIDDAAGVALVGDLSDDLIPVPLPALAEARAQVTKDKNRLLALEPAGKMPNLKTMVRSGVAACAESLGKGKMKNFTLEAFATWADRLHGSKAPGSWDKIFPRGHLLFQGLRSITEFIEFYGTGGGLCRPLFAEFLGEASEALSDRRLASLAKRYAELGRGWSALADAALPDEVPEFREAKELLARKAEAVAAETDATGAAEVSFCNRAMEEAAASMKKAFPLDEAASEALRKRLKERLLQLVEGERAGLAGLQAWV